MSQPSADPTAVGALTPDAVRRPAQQRGRCINLRKCKRRINRYCQIILSPRRLSLVLTESLDEWVSQKTVIGFAFIEMCASFATVAFYVLFPSVGRLGVLWSRNSWFLFAFIVFIRGCGGLLGIFGSFFRKVRLTRFYFWMLGVQMPLTFLVCQPLWHTACECGVDSNLDTYLQCMVLCDFSEMTSDCAHSLTPPTSTGGAGRQLAPDAGLHKLHDRLSEYFNITHPGIGWWAAKKDCLPQRIQLTQTDSIQAARLLGVILQPRIASARASWAELLRCGADWAIQLGDDYLTNCIFHRSCGGVEVRFEKMRSHYEVDLCNYTLPVVPILQNTRPGETVVAFQKNVITSAQVRQAKTVQMSGWCALVVKLVLVPLILLELVSVPMFIIVLKFLTKRCGDFTARETQFDVDFSSESGEDDDFNDNVNTFRHSMSWNKSTSSGNWKGEHGITSVELTSKMQADGVKASDFSTMRECAVTSTGSESFFEDNSVVQKATTSPSESSVRTSQSNLYNW